MFCKTLECIGDPSGGEPEQHVPAPLAIFTRYKIVKPFTWKELSNREISRLFVQIFIKLQKIFNLKISLIFSTNNFKVILFYGLLTFLDYLNYRKNYFNLCFQLSKMSYWFSPKICWIFHKTNSLQHDSLIPKIQLYYDDSHIKVSYTRILVYCTYPTFL